MFRLSRRLISILALSSLLAGCGQRSTAIQSGAADQALHRGAGVEPSTLDPQRNNGAPEAEIIRALFEPLVYADPANVNEVLPKAAERFEISPDGLTYDFYLRPAARWSNGDPVVAEDYRAAILRLLEPALAGTLVDYAYPIAGAEDFHRGRLKDAAKVGVEAPGPLHLRIRLRAPTPHFIYQMEDYPFVPVHRPSVEANGGWLNPTSPWTRAGIMVGNGPFRLVRWRPGQDLLVERNPHYWDAANVKLRSIQFHPIDSIDTEERAFRAGQLHVTYNFPASRLPTYRASKSPALRVNPRLGVHFLFLNTTKPPLTDARVRRALAYAIDRVQLAEKVFACGEAPGLTLSQPGMGGFQPRNGITAGPAEARRLLAEAGFAGGAGFPTLVYVFNTSERNRDVAQTLQQMWQRELGIRLELRNEEWKVFLDNRQVGNYDIARAGWLPFTPEQSEFFRLCHSSSPNNDSKWRDAAFDALCDRASTTMDRAERHELYHELDRIILEHMPVVPLVHYSLVRLVDPSVQAWQNNPRDKQFLELISLGRGAAP